MLGCRCADNVLTSKSSKDMFRWCIPQIITARECETNSGPAGEPPAAAGAADDEVRNACAEKVIREGATWYSWSGDPCIFSALENRQLSVALETVRQGS